MPRRADPPELQAAKGDPGRRKGKVKTRAATNRRIAELLSSAPTGDLLTPPMLSDPMFAPALAVWRELAPGLAKTHRLPAESRMIFVQLCVYMAEWLEAQVDVAENGFDQKVQTIAGGVMERDRPAVKRRQQAFDNVLRLSVQFGLTPHDMYALFKDQAGVAATSPGLFGRDDKAANPVREDVAPTKSVVGAASRLRSAPPSSRPN